MARTLHQLTLFASGPSDVDSEKAALRVVVDEINRRSEKTHAVTLRVVDWPHDIRPGVSTDAQSEVNRQIGTEFDIYVGILGCRFGTPTTRSGSGTEEEFEGTLSRFQKDTTSVRVLFYFKRDAEDPFLLDIPQLQRVRDFRESLGRRGVLYRDFRDTSEFTKLVREHLDGLIIDEWRGENWTELSSSAIQDSISSSLPSAVQSGPTPEDSVEISECEGDEDELGVLEYMAAFHEASNALFEVMAAISQATQRVGEEIGARAAESDLMSEELEKHKGIGGSRVQQQFLGQARASVDRAAANLEEFVIGMKPNVEQYKIHNHAFFDNMKRAFHASAELGPRDNIEDREALTKLIPVIHESREHLMGFQASIGRVPALTGRFKRSRKRAAAILGELVAEMSFSIQEAGVLLEEMGGDPADSAG